MTSLRALVPAVAVLVVLVTVGGLASLGSASGSSLPAPHLVRSSGSTLAPSAPASSAHGAPVDVAAPRSAAAPHPALSCPTPGGAPSWQSSNFFTDVAVSFWTPGSPALSGQGFGTVPCDNVVPTYTNGFWLNVSTNVAISVAQVRIWGTGWPTPSVAQPDLKGFSPANPATFSMLIAAPFFHTASFYFNDYRYFWPGSQVYFNLTLSTTQATPSTIYSANPLTQYYEPIPWSGGVNNATWAFYVASPFAPTPPGFTPVNFSNIMAVATTPSVLTTPAFEPNPKQTVQIYLSSLNLSGAPAMAIPQAQGQFTLSGGYSGTYYANFGPQNHTTMQLLSPLGPYPGTKVQFNITCWLPWEGGAIDRVYSPTYSFNWSPNGSWWNLGGGLENNVNIVSFPDVTSALTGNSLATGTPVNVSIHSYTQNVTISSAAIHFRYADTNGITFGQLPMTAANANTTYAILPGLPPSASLTFSIVAKDIYGNPMSSGNYSYRESGPLGATLAPGYGMFFFEVIDVATGNLVPNVNFTISNNTWSETAKGYSLGFANPLVVGGPGSLPVAYGTYVVTVHAFGGSQTWTGSLATQTPFMVVFYLTSSPISPTYATPTPSLTLPAAIGLIGAAVAMVPIANWFRERRKKAEAEQRRISL